MNSILVTIFTFLLVLSSLLLILLTLMQQGNANAGLGSAFGGNIAEAAFGANTGNILVKGTIFCSLVFFILSFSLYLNAIRTVGKQDQLPDIPNVLTEPHTQVKETQDTSPPPPSSLEQ
jgi:preprotein translocase subunit SecG